MPRRKIPDSDKIVVVSIWVKKKNSEAAKKEVIKIEKKYR